MKSVLKSFLLLAFVIMATGCSSRKKIDIFSPDGNIRLIIISASNSPDHEIAGFSVYSGVKKVLLPSSLMIGSKTIDLNNKFKITGIERQSINNRWTNNFGERKEIPDNYNFGKIFLEYSDTKINLILRVYNLPMNFQNSRGRIQ
jgi:hypothetical protein